MDPISAIAASGLRARMESLELLANNVANATTEGYKADREFYTLYTAPEAEDSNTMPLIERPWIDMSQGLIHETGNPLDLALQGKGFFAVDGPSGPLYTRNGNFRLAGDGRMITSDGYPVRGSGKCQRWTAGVELSSVPTPRPMPRSMLLKTKWWTGEKRYQ